MSVGKKSILDSARLFARPNPITEAGLPGIHQLPIGRKRRALLRVPEGLSNERQAALAVMLHGAGGNADHGLGILSPYAERAGLIVLAPESRKTSWDLISDSRYGPDVKFIDECLKFVFSRYQIDPRRIALGGFSDGASYALSLGLSNGSLFRYLLAFSPGFMAPLALDGNPFVFVSHGTQDQVLPIDSCSRRLVRALRSGGRRVEYYEFDGPHTVPDEYKKRAVEILFAPDSG